MEQILIEIRDSLHRIEANQRQLLASLADQDADIEPMFTLDGEPSGATRNTIEPL
jgi:hypothetical protein